MFSRDTSHHHRPLDSPRLYLEVCLGIKNLGHLVSTLCVFQACETENKDLTDGAGSGGLPLTCTASQFPSHVKP
jgi:hypothetical protein